MTTAAAVVTWTMITFSFSPGLAAAPGTRSTDDFSLTITPGFQSRQACERAISPYPGRFSFCVEGK